MSPFAGFILALLFCSIAQNMCAAEEAGMAAGHVNVKDFSRLVVTGDWSPAIQAAIDHVSAANGYEAGATVFFPPGTYKLDKKIVLGKDAAAVWDAVERLRREALGHEGPRRTAAGLQTEVRNVGR